MTFARMAERNPTVTIRTHIAFGAAICNAWMETTGCMEVGCDVGMEVTGCKLVGCDAGVEATGTLVDEVQPVRRMEKSVKERGVHNWHHRVFCIYYNVDTCVLQSCENSNK